MKSKKLLEKIANWLDEEQAKKRDHREELEALLQKLKQKEAKLEEKLQQETNQRKHEQLSLNLNIVRLQQEKGNKILQELQES
ncbi:MAG: hypothetical protein KDI83_10885 [Gammaproteobacteria bacterium]|nr:hypothetical protein [Gammaproteobacteria bacterium]